MSHVVTDLVKSNNVCQTFISTILTIISIHKRMELVLRSLKYVCNIYHDTTELSTQIICREEFGKHKKVDEK